MPRRAGRLCGRALRPARCRCIRPRRVAPPATSLPRAAAQARRPEVTSVDTESVMTLAVHVRHGRWRLFCGRRTSVHDSVEAHPSRVHNAHPLCRSLVTPQVLEGMPPPSSTWGTFFLWYRLTAVAVHRSSTELTELLLHLWSQQSPTSLLHFRLSTAIPFTGRPTLSHRPVWEDVLKAHAKEADILLVQPPDVLNARRLCLHALLVGHRLLFDR